MRTQCSVFSSEQGRWHLCCVGKLGLGCISLGAVGPWIVVSCEIYSSIHSLLHSAIICSAHHHVPSRELGQYNRTGYLASWFTSWNHRMLKCKGPKNGQNLTSQIKGLLKTAWVTNQSTLNLQTPRKLLFPLYSTASTNRCQYLSSLSC